MELPNTESANGVEVHELRRCTQVFSGHAMLTLRVAVMDAVYLGDRKSGLCAMGICICSICGLDLHLAYAYRFSDGRSVQRRE